MALPKLAQTTTHCNRFDTMLSTTHFDTLPVIPPLALRSRDAAIALGISERLLQEWAKHQDLPCIRIGQVVLYPVDEVRQWLRQRAIAEPKPAVSSN
jgi:hypothetical protein